MPARHSPLRRPRVILWIGALLLVACADRAPSSPGRPPPSRSLLPSVPTTPTAPSVDPFAPPRSKNGRLAPPRAALQPDPSIGGGAVSSLVQSHSVPVYPGAPGRDLAAELRSRLGGLESCVVRAPTRSQTTWEVDYNNPNLARTDVERRAAPPEPARTIRVSATFNTAGRVSSATVSVSPPVDSTAQQCMQGRVEAVGLAPMQARSTVEVTVGLAPRG